MANSESKVFSCAHGGNEKESQAKQDEGSFHGKEVWVFVIFEFSFDVRSCFVV